MYWNALQDAASKNDLERLHGYVLMFCRLQVAALRAWAQVAQGEASEPDTLDYEQMLRQNGSD